MNKENSHTILNEIERLRIMHDLIKGKRFEQIPEEEIMQDVIESLERLREAFFSTDQ